jgi:hypothetical protein
MSNPDKFLTGDDNAMLPINAGGCNTPFDAKWKSDPEDMAEVKEAEELIKTIPPITLTLDEGERQLVLKALAHLSIIFPGWEYATSRVAHRIDNTREGRPQLYDDFRELAVLPQIQRLLESK